MNRRLLAAAAILLLAITARQLRHVEAQQLVVVTPESLGEPIQLAGDEKAVRRFLDAYAVQTRAGWGNGPLIGSFSTPFSRVVQAAIAARKRGETFVATNVTPELISPELHVIASSQRAGDDDAILATVQSVTLAPRGSKNPEDMIKPLKTNRRRPESRGLS